MKTILTFEQAKTKFINGGDIWCESEILTQDDIDENEEYEGYTAGDILSYCMSLDLGDSVEDLDEENTYFKDEDEISLYHDYMDNKR